MATVLANRRHTRLLFSCFPARDRALEHVPERKYHATFVARGGNAPEVRVGLLPCRVELSRVVEALPRDLIEQVVGFGLERDPLTLRQPEVLEERHVVV